jgi:putative selenium metabolism hydrolase
MIDFLRGLVATPSLSGHEEAAIDLCAKEMERLGFAVERDDAGNLLGVVGNGSPRLLFDAHADTVAANPGWTRDPHDPQIAGARMYGLASTDMKGSLAALVHGVAAAARAGTVRGTAAVSITTLEEVMEGAALTRVLDHFTPDAVVIAEPSSCRVALAQKGRAEIELKVGGKGAHAAFPSRGVNALTAAARILTALEERVPPSDPDLGDGILVATEARTEPFPGVSVVPSRCVLRLDRRTLPGESEESVLAELEPYLGLAEEMGAVATASISTGEVRTYTDAVLPAHRFLPAWRADPMHSFIRAARSVLPVGGPAAFCTNGSATASRGITTLIFGPGDPSLAHQADEYVELADLEEGRAGFAALASVPWDAPAGTLNA